jgi:hypothetical protein
MLVAVIPASLPRTVLSHTARGHCELEVRLRRGLLISQFLEHQTREEARHDVDRCTEPLVQEKVSSYFLILDVC